MADPPKREGERPCQLCGAPIWFVKTVHGRTMPLDVKSQLRVIINRQGLAEVAGVFTTHFETCPRANEARKAKEKAPCPPNTATPPRSHAGGAAGASGTS